MNPTAGKSIFFSVKAAASVLGANVNMIQPTFDAQYYHVSPRWHKNVLAFHFMATTITGYGGKEVAAVRARVHRRRERHSRIRFLQHHADRLPAEQRERQRAESGRQPANTECAGQRILRDDERRPGNSDLSDHHARAATRTLFSISSTGFRSSGRSRWCRSSTPA